MPGVRRFEPEASLLRTDGPLAVEEVGNATFDHARRTADYVQCAPPAQDKRVGQIHRWHWRRSYPQHFLPNCAGRFPFEEASDLTVRISTSLKEPSDEVRCA